ncbi:hypothetical protein GF389_02740 [Candidatus Dojkabacteria bacterium]|nr:hypothetical protein [Candidatus Dojkabacteria bacterium]
MKKSANIKWLRIVALIWSVPLIILTLLIAWGYFYNYITTGAVDSNTADHYPFIENFPPIFMFFAVIGLLIAWRKERLGALINISFVLVTLVILLIHWPFWRDTRDLIPYGLQLVIVVPGILFFLHSRKSGK